MIRLRPTLIRFVCFALNRIPLHRARFAPYWKRMDTTWWQSPRRERRSIS